MSSVHLSGLLCCLYHEALQMQFVFGIHSYLPKNAETESCGFLKLMIFRWGFLIIPETGEDFQAALVASCLGEV